MLIELPGMLIDKREFAVPVISQSAGVSRQFKLSQDRRITLADLRRVCRRDFNDSFRGK